MIDFRTFLKSERCNDIIIQLALREIDAAPLALALSDKEDGTKEPIFRNMSQRAVAALKVEILHKSDAAPEARRLAEELFGQLLEKSATLYAERNLK
jgi:flagellar motor switch protein FliG